MWQRFLLVLAIVILGVCYEGLVSADEAAQIAAGANTHSNLIHSAQDATDSRDANAEERGLGKITSLFRRGPKVSKTFDSGPVAAGLAKNPSLVKSFQENPQLGQKLESFVHQNPAFVNNLKTNPSLSKLRSMVARNPSRLNRKTIEHVGAYVAKESSFARFQGAADSTVQFLIGMIFVVVALGLVGTFAGVVSVAAWGLSAHSRG